MTEVDLKEAIQDHVGTISDMLAGGSTYTTQRWTDPAGNVAYEFTSSSGVIVNNGEPRPNVPADSQQSHSVVGAFIVITITREWTKAPWAGWREFISISTPRTP
jgi:hypothetical protein